MLCIEYLQIITRPLHDGSISTAEVAACGRHSINCKHCAKVCAALREAYAEILPDNLREQVAQRAQETIDKIATDPELRHYIP